MTGGDAGQALDHDPLIERHHQADHRRQREPLAVEPVLVHHPIERISQHRTPLALDLGEAFRDVWAMPTERLQLEPDLGVTGGQVGLEVPSFTRGSEWARGF